MCLISVLPKGTKKNTEKVYKFIESGFNCNQDGSGFMFKRNGENTVTINKGYFNLSRLIENIKKLDLKEEDELVIHHRIGTAGKICPENTHPFLVSSVESEINVTDITINKPALVHNGIIYGVKDYMTLNSDFCDTYAFARYIMANENVLNLYKDYDTLFKELFNHYLGTDKLCLLFPDRDLKMYGYFQNDDGYYHSNSGYNTKVKNWGGYETFLDEEEHEDIGTAIGFKQPFQCAVQPNEQLRFGSTMPKVLSLPANNSLDNNVNTQNLKNSIFPLNENNVKYFYFKLPGRGDKLYWLTNYNINSDSQMFIRKDGAATLYIPIKTQSILNDEIIFVPKNPNFTRVVVDYLYLVKKLPDYSKNRLKLTQKIIENNFAKSIFHEIVYKPLKNLGYNNNKFYKLTLLLYVDYLKNKSNANSVKSTDFIEDAVVVD